MLLCVCVLLICRLKWYRDVEGRWWWKNGFWKGPLLWVRGCLCVNKGRWMQGSSSFLSIFSLFIMGCEICSVVFLNDSIKMDDGIWIGGKKGHASQREKIVLGWVISMIERTWICCYVCAFCLFAGWSGTMMLRGGDDEKVGFEKGHYFGCVGVYVWTKGDECKAGDEGCRGRRWGHEVEVESEIESEVVEWNMLSPVMFLCVFLISGVGCFIGEEEWRIRKCIGRIWLAKIGENVGVSNGMWCA